MLHFNTLQAREATFVDATNPPSPSSVPNGPPLAERQPFRRVELLLIFGFWTLIALLTAANVLIDPRGRSPMTVFAAPRLRWPSLPRISGRC